MSEVLSLLQELQLKIRPTGSRRVCAQVALPLLLEETIDLDIGGYGGRACWKVGRLE
jgi:hypothetical protein